jgi:cytochrome c-type biogenesis protein
MADLSPVAAFVAGTVSFLSPCVLPLVPGYVSLISGATIDELQQSQDRKLLAGIMAKSMSFIVGFSVVFISLGAAATKIGQITKNYRDILSIVAGAVIILFGLHLTGLLQIKALYSDKRIHSVAGGKSMLGAFAVGFAFAFGWTPCIGPILATILAAAAATQTAVWGGVLLVCYSIGLGLPFVVLAIGFQRAKGSLEWLKRHGRHVELVGGVLLVGVGLLFVSGAWRSFFIPLQRYFARFNWPPI